MRVELHAASVPGRRRLSNEGVIELRARGADEPPLTGLLPPTVATRAVRVTLAPGEVAVLRAWLVPSAADLEDLFEMIESGTRLLAAEGRTRGCDGPGACAAGLQALLGQIPPTQDSRATLAAIWHARLRQAPLPELCDAAELRLIHATETADELAMLGDFTLARPASLEAGLDRFLAEVGPAAGWGGFRAEDGATAMIAAGRIRLDRWTTSGFTLEALMPAPGREMLDVPAVSLPAPLVPPRPDPGTLRREGFAVRDGAPDFACRTRWVEVLTVEGIPLPEDGAPGPTEVVLEQLLAGQVPGFAGATVRYATPLETGQARQVALRLVPRARHAALLAPTQTAASRPAPAATLPARPAAAGAAPRSDATCRPGPERSLWLPATIRPGPPEPMELVPTFAWNQWRESDGRTVSVRRERTGGFRLVLRRPWFGSGEDERIGIVLWPPPAIPLPGGTQAGPGETELAALHEDDLGPLGRFVSVWGVDPTGPLAGRGAGRHRFLTREQFRLPPVAGWEPLVLMPLPGQPGEEREGVAHISLLTLPVNFDAESPNGFVDFGLALDAGPDPFIRLGLVRFQGHARPDQLGVPAPARPSIRCSAPVALQSQTMPARRVVVTSTPMAAAHGAPGPTTVVRVVVSGMAAEPLGGDQMIVELRERQGAAERAVRDAAGQPARAVWPDGTLRRLERADPRGEFDWSAVFVLAGDVLAAKREVVAVVREDALAEAAADPPDGAGESPYLALPRFLATVPLDGTP